MACETRDGLVSIPVELEADVDAYRRGGWDCSEATNARAREGREVRKEDPVSA